MFLASAVISQPAVSQSFSTPETEYKKRVQVSDAIEPLGENPVGENIGLYTGALNFEHEDVREDGRGPALSITRSFEIPDENPSYAFHAFHSNAFVDWNLEIPRIETLSAPTKVTTNGIVSYQWFLVDDYYGTVRCNGVSKGPSMYVSQGATTATYTSEQWWHGYHLLVPGAGSQTLIARSSGNTQVPTMNGDDGSPITFNIVTKDHWAVGCLASTSNGQPGPGYIAVAPDGTRYYLDVLTIRSADAVIGIAGAALKRKLLTFSASKVVDRFGNTVHYYYDANGNLTSLQGDDGRRIDITWEQWQAPTTDPGPALPSSQYTSFRITRVDEQPTSTEHRVWTYAYDTSNTYSPRLKTVTLPDGTAWQFDLGGLPATNPEALLTYGSQGTCLYTAFPSASTTGSGSITGPSGITEQFTAMTTLRGRSMVPVPCSNPSMIGMLPKIYATTSVTRRVRSGAGITPQTWSYSYSPANESWAEDCHGCATTVYTDVTDPSGNTTRSTFSNAFDVTEGVLQRTDAYQGAVSGTPVRSEILGYASGGPWPGSLGTTWQAELNEAPLTQLYPVSSKTIALRGQDGGIDTFTWSASSFNAFGQPTGTTRSSSTNPASLSETFSYQNDGARWVLGLSAQQVNAASGEVENSIAYDAASLPTARYRFGQVVQTFHFDTYGQLSSFTDGRGNVTALTGYQRGVPGQIQFQDGYSEYYTVNDFGEVSSKTDKAGNQTQYTYWPSGRLKQTTYPAGDQTAWAPRNYSYDFIAAAERGIDANHLRRTVTQGDSTSITYFDAMLRPVLTESYRTSDGGLHTTARTDYDWRGHTLKQYYPQAGAPMLGSFTLGAATSYDALGRVAGTAQDTEIGQVTTATSYLSGARVQIRDARNGVATTAYQMLDQPGYLDPIQMVSSADASHTVTQTVVRDIYGNPTLLTQGGDVSTTKSLAYDAQYRICRITEPEDGSLVTAYDAAGNVDWTAGGMSYTGAGDEHDCATAGADASAKVSRTYDTLNELTSVAYADGTPGRTVRYTPTGKPAHAESGPATWDYTYNKMDLLASETLSIDGNRWELDYTYDPNGSLASIRYPDGTSVAANPDALGRPTTAGSFATGAQYGPDGSLMGFNYGSGATYAASVNLRGLPSEISFGTPSNIVISQDMSYDANGNLTHQGDAVGAQSHVKDFTYDSLNRLTTASALGLWGADSYTYNALGDLVGIQEGSTSTTLTYDGANRFSHSTINGAAGSSYVYDGRGNVVQRNGATYIYDQANHLTSVVGGATYDYDANNRRVRRTDPSGRVTYYLYSQAGALLMEVDKASSTATDHIYLGDKLVANQTTLLAPVGTPSLMAPAAGAANTPYTVSWTAVPSATSYALQESTNGGAYVALGSPTGTSQSVTHASAGAYAYRVAACNGGGCGAWSASATTTVSPPPSAPSAPASVSAVVSSNWTSVTLTWPTVATATYYNVQQKVGAGAWTAVASNLAAITTSIANPPDGTYTYQVQACSAAGCSGWTASAATPVARIPSAPASISVPGTSAGSITISWPAAAYATSYTVEASFNGGAFGAVASTGGTSYGYSVGASGTYAYRVKGCNVNGCGGYSPQGSVVVTLPPSAAPSLSVPGSSSSGAYSVVWSGVATATSYVLQESVNGGGFATVQSSGATSWNASGKGNATYGYHVQACNAGGCGPWSATGSVSVALVPAVPTGLTLTTTGWATKLTIHLAWNAMPGATSYQIEQKLGNGTPTVVYNGTATTWLSYFIYDGTVSYHVQACNASGCSAFSSYVSTQLQN